VVGIPLARGPPNISRAQHAKFNLDQFYPHVSNFDRTDRLAGCEERWGPGGREVDDRRVIIEEPLDGSDPSREETCDL
jgi:hypothetical protein